MATVTSSLAIGRQVAQQRIVKPRPDLKPAEVVAAQLKALKENEADNRGIARCFEFASPGNRLITGPLDNFITMLRITPYKVLLNHQKSLIGTTRESDGHAWMVVTIIDRNEQLAVLMFQLSKQERGNYQGCWMTDAVLPLPIQAIER